jgi:membrane associated rhomboid family serine protease
LPPLTVALAVVCVLVTVVSDFGSARDILAPLIISAPGSELLANVRAGEVWRLLTPIFIHLSVLYLVFNMLWLWDLGRMIETRRGLLMFGLFVLAVGIASNLAQYLITGSPYSGGMSGVVYGLLGYAWMQSRFNPRSGYVLHNHIVVMMLVWYVLCWTGLLGPIANWAHPGGLVIGVVWGFLDRK